MDRLKEKQQQKLAEARTLLKALEIPSLYQQANSDLIFLALANIKPESNWSMARDHRLSLLDIERFIQLHYDEQVSISPEETALLETFEDKQLINKITHHDDSDQAATANSYYSMRAGLIKALHRYPSDNWLTAIVNFLNQMDFERLYLSKMELTQTPIQLPNGPLITLDSNRHTSMHANIMHAFYPQFIGGGGFLLYLSDTSDGNSEKPFFIWEEYPLKALGFESLFHSDMPDVVILDKKRNHLYLLQTLTGQGPITIQRWHQLEQVFKPFNFKRHYISVFEDRLDFAPHSMKIAWQTSAWLSNHPDKIIHYHNDHLMPNKATNRS